MKTFLKRTIFTIGTIWLSWHVLATALYLGPNNPMTKHYQPAIQAYMEPFFIQNWNLFAPEPATSSLQMWYRCEDNKSWSKWMDPLSNLIKQHQANRFTHKGKLIYVYQGLSRNLLNDYVTKKNQLKCRDKACEDQLMTNMKSVNHYKMAQKFVSSLCLTRNSKTSQFQILKVYPKSYSKRHEKKPYSKIESVMFPKFQI